MKRALTLSDESQPQAQPQASRQQVSQPLPSEADERFFAQLVTTGVLRLR